MSIYLYLRITERMATPLDSLDALFTCPVCLEKYRDPRILSCGHHFCVGCLEGVYQGQSNVWALNCPTCRHSTPLGAGKTVLDLPRPVMVNELQQKVTELVRGGGGRRGSTTRLCGLCDHGRQHAVRHCYECSENLCQACAEKHERVRMFAGHQTVQISESLFCKSHPTRAVTVYCGDCKKGLCKKCLVSHPQPHKVDTIQKLAGKSRGRLQQFVLRCKPIDIDLGVLKEMNSNADHLEENKDNMMGKISKIRDLMKTFETRLGAIEKVLQAKVTNEVEKMKMYETSVLELNQSQGELIKYANYLIHHAPEAELVLKEKDVTLDIPASELNNFSIRFPAENSLDETVSGFLKVISGCDIKYQTVTIKDFKKIASEKHAVEQRHLRLREIDVEVENMDQMILLGESYHGNFFYEGLLSSKAELQSERDKLLCQHTPRN